MSKRGTKAMDIGEVLSNQPEQIQLDETRVEVPSIIEKPKKEIFIRPGFILIREIKSGGELVVAESQYGRIYTADQWEKVTDSKKK